MNSPKQYIKTLITAYNSWIAFSINQQLRPSTLALRNSNFELRTKLSFTLSSSYSKVSYSLSFPTTKSVNSLSLMQNLCKFAPNRFCLSLASKQLDY